MPMASTMQWLGIAETDLVVKVLEFIDIFEVVGCVFVTEATHFSIKTGSEQGSYASPIKRMMEVLEAATLL